MTAGVLDHEASRSAGAHDRHHAAAEASARLSGWRSWLAVGALLAVHAFLLVDGARLNAPALDELIYAPAGYATWTLGDQTFNAEHPPALKLLFGAAWLGSGIQADAHALSRGELPMLVGQRFLYEGRSKPAALLLRARLVTVCLSLATALAVFLLARRLEGFVAGWVALTLYVLDPLVLGHGGLATLDVGAATFFFLAGCALGLDWMQGWKRLLWAGLLVGFAVATKLSTLPILLGVLGALVAAWRNVLAGSRGWLLVRGAALLSVAALVLSLLCLPEGPRFFLRALNLQMEHARDGHGAFAFGRYSDRGWWWYYPAAWLVKTPLPTLVMSIAGIVLLLARVRRDSRLLVPHVLSAAGLAGAAVISHSAIGVRNLLPLVPILCVGGGLAGARLWAEGRRWRWGLPLLLLWLGVGTIAVHPSELSFANEAAGGTSAGHRLLSDSNVDWGIDLSRVPAIIDRQPLRRLYLVYFGSARPAAHGIPRYQWMPAPSFAPRLSLDGPDAEGREWVAISVTALTGPYPPGPMAYAWLADRTPTARAGPSILLFDITGDAEAHRRMGLTALVSGASRQGMLALQRSFELAPSDPLARNTLLAAYVRTGDSVSAMRLCERPPPDRQSQELCAMAATRAGQTGAPASP